MQPISSDPEIALQEVVWCLCVSCPLWVPLILAAFFAGRGRFGIRALLLLTAATAIAICFARMASQTMLYRQ
jgi:hypothetical protein